MKLEEWGSNPDGDVGKQFRKKEDISLETKMIVWTN